MILFNYVRPKYPLLPLIYIILLFDSDWLYLFVVHDC